MVGTKTFVTHVSHNLFSSVNPDITLVTKYRKQEVTKKHRKREGGRGGGESGNKPV